MTLRLAAQPQPPRDLGADAAQLWRHRFEAERDVLAALSMNPGALWPTLIRNGIGMSCFDDEYHRVAFVCFEHARRFGAPACARLIGAWCRNRRVNPSVFEPIYDRFPQSAAHLEYQAARLRDIITVCRDAERHLAIARRTVEAAVGRHEHLYHAQTRSVGGYSGTAVHNHTVPAHQKTAVKTQHASGPLRLHGAGQKTGRVTSAVTPRAKVG